MSVDLIYMPHTKTKKKTTNQKVNQRNFLMGDSHLQRSKKSVFDNNDDSKD